MADEANIFTADWIGVFCIHIRGTSGILRGYCRSGYYAHLVYSSERFLWSARGIDRGTSANLGEGAGSRNE